MTGGGAAPASWGTHLLCQALLPRRLLPDVPSWVLAVAVGKPVSRAGTSQARGSPIFRPGGQEEEESRAGPTCSPSAPTPVLSAKWGTVKVPPRRGVRGRGLMEVRHVSSGPRPGTQEVLNKGSQTNHLGG